MTINEDQQYARETPALDGVAETMDMLAAEIDRLRRDKDALVRALRWASLEIHNPGAGRTSNIDVIEVINEALAEHGK